MGASIHSLEWLNKNSLRAYPIKEDASRSDLTGSYDLVDDFIVDLVFVIDTHKDRRFFIKFLSVLGEVVTLQLYDETDAPAASITIDGALHTTYQAYPVLGLGDYTGALGKLVVGELGGLFRNSQGLFEFSLAGLELEPSTIIPDIRGVTSLSKFSDIPGALSPQLRGHVRISDGTNTQVRIDPEQNLFRIDAIEGAGLGPQCDCPDEFRFPECISFINGIAPDNSFNFNIRGVGCISIEPIDYGIRIRDTCAEPCCDCDEISDLVARLEALEASSDNTQLTGILTFLNGSTAVTGAGSLFSSEVAAGDLVQLATDGTAPGSVGARVASVSNDTSLTLTAPYAGAGGAGAGNRKRELS